MYSGYSAPGSRIAGMEIQEFRNENSSQTNAYSHYSNYSYSELIPNERALTGVTEGVFHLPRDSGNSGWVVNGTWFFGLFHWKISGKNGTFEKVVPFSRWKFSDGTPCSIYGFRKGFYQFQAALGHRNMAATPNVSLRSWPWTIRMLKPAYQGELEAFQTRVVEELSLWLLLLGTEVQGSF